MYGHYLAYFVHSCCDMYFFMSLLLYIILHYEYGCIKCDGNVVSDCLMCISLVSFLLFFFSYMYLLLVSSFRRIKIIIRYF